MLDKKKFLSQVYNYLLDVFIDDKHYQISGCGSAFSSFVSNTYDKEMIYLSELYSDIPTLFVIFAINSVEAPSKSDTYPLIEWRVIDTLTGEEITSHFSYQLPGDGTQFSCKLSKNSLTPMFRIKKIITNFVNSEKNLSDLEPFIFIASDKRSLRVPVIHLTPRFKKNLGVIAVQESEAVANLDDLVTSTASDAAMGFLFDIPVKIVDRRKHKDNCSIEEEKLIYNRSIQAFTLPILCKPRED